MTPYFEASCLGMKQAVFLLRVLGHKYTTVLLRLWSDLMIVINAVCFLQFRIMCINQPVIHVVNTTLQECNISIWTDIDCAVYGSGNRRTSCL